MWAQWKENALVKHSSTQTVSLSKFSVKTYCLNDFCWESSIHDAVPWPSHFWAFFKLHYNCCFQKFTSWNSLFNKFYLNGTFMSLSIDYPKPHTFITSTQLTLARVVPVVLGAQLWTTIKCIPAVDIAPEIIS